MKKLVIKSLLCLLTSFVVILVLNLMYMRTSYWKYENGVDKFMNVPGHIQLANTGSSHGGCFDYTDIPYRSFNFALPSQLYPYDYAILQQYIDNFDKNAVLIILVEYFEITGIKKDYSDPRYYRFLDKEFIPGFSTINYLRYVKIPVLSSTNTIFKIFFDTNYEKKIAEDIAFGKSSLTLPVLAIVSEGRYYYFTNDEPTGFTTEEGAKGFAYNKNLVSKMIELCIAHDIQPVLISTPVTDMLNNQYTERKPEFFDTFSRFTREIRAEYPSVPYFDYSRDPRFESDYTLFADSDHLNIFGAEKFTAIVVADLQAAGLLDTLPRCPRASVRDF